MAFLHYVKFSAEGGEFSNFLRSFEQFRYWNSEKKLKQNTTFLQRIENKVYLIPFLFPFLFSFRPVTVRYYKDFEKIKFFGFVFRQRSLYVFRSLSFLSCFCLLFLAFCPSFAFHIVKRAFLIFLFCLCLELEIEWVAISRPSFSQSFFPSFSYWCFFIKVFHFIFNSTKIWPQIVQTKEL